MVGGLEAFVETLIDELHARGHDIAFWTETDLPANRPRIALPSGVASWSVDEIGLERALNELRGWAPQVLSTHGILDPSIERCTLSIAPATFFAHAYTGTCISGSKAFSLPETSPCSERFGPSCLLHYYMRRCGGLSPLTMAREYRRQSRRLALLERYRRIFTRSRHMRDEYLRHGFAADQLKVVELDLDATAIAFGEDVEVAARSLTGPTQPLRLLFLGRMDRLKGGRVLLDALPKLAERDRPLRLVFAGDGPDRSQWEHEARRLTASTSGIDVVFEGWVDGERRAELLNDSDLLMVPSLWPEPWGDVGHEAGLAGVPAVGFAVGGIPEWLVDDVSGCLAPGDPPRVDGLVAATNRAVRDPATYRRLSRGAARSARAFDARRGIDVVAEELEKLARGTARGFSL
jgi:glycosyltransferase involved in cell wall biosynthesis